MKMFNCGCGRIFESSSSHHFHIVRSVNTACTTDRSLVQSRNKRRRTTRNPEPKATYLPPGVGGLGRKRAGDNIFPLVADGVFPGDDIVNNSMAGCSNSSEPQCDSLPDLEIENATDEQLKEVYHHLVREIASRNAKGPLDRLMKVMMHPNWTARGLAEQVRENKSQGVDGARASLESDMASKMREDGFVERRVRNPYVSDQYVTMWMRDPVMRLQAQLAKAVTSGKDMNFFTDPFRAMNRDGECCVSHPMNGALANRVIPEIEKAVDDSQEPGVQWTRPGAHNLPTSMVILAQVYSDVSQVSMSTTAVAFYPLQVCSMNFTSAAKDEMVIAGDAVVAYLPTDKTWRRDEEMGQQIQRGYDANAPDEIESNDSEGDKDMDFADLDSTDSESMDISAEYNDEDGDERAPRLKKAERPSREIYASCVGIALGSLRKISKKGIIYKTADGKKRKGHVALASMVADTPEIAHASGLKHSYCNKCTCPRHSLNGETGFDCEGNMRDVDIARSLRRQMDKVLNADKRDTAEEKEILAEYAAHDLHPVQSAFEEWPFSKLPGLSLYEIFRYDYLHSNPLGLSVKCLEVMFNRVTSTSVKTNNRSKFDPSIGAIREARGKMTSSSRRRGSILLALNTLCVSIQRDSPCTGFRVDYTRQKMVGTLNGLFTDGGVLSMLQGKHLKQVTQVIPFLAALTDRLTQHMPEEDCAAMEPILTDFVTAYVEMDAAVTKKDLVDQSFTRLELDELEEKIERYAKFAVGPEIAQYQKSMFNFIKFHKARAHLRKDIEELGAVAYYCSSPFESSHSPYKAQEKLTSRRVASGVSETVALLTKQSVYRLHLSSDIITDRGKALVYKLISGKSTVSVHQRQTCKISAMKTDQAKIVGKAVLQFKAHDLEVMLRKVKIKVDDLGSYLSRKGVKMLHINSALGRSRAGCSGFIRLCGGPGFLAVPIYDIMKRLALAHLTKGAGLPDMDMEEAQNFAIRKMDIMKGLNVKVVNSLFVPGVDTPTMRAVMSPRDIDGDGIISISDNQCRHMQRVISTLQFSHSKQKWQDNVLVQAQSKNAHSVQDLWVAKVLAIVRITSDEGHFSEEQNNDNVILRYYATLNRGDYSLIDESLGCIKLKWAVSELGDPWVDIQPVGAVRGRVHVVPDGMHMLSEAECSASGEKADTWPDRRFYINRFKFSNYEALYMLGDRDV